MCIVGVTDYSASRNQGQAREFLGLGCLGPWLRLGSSMSSAGHFGYGYSGARTRDIIWLRLELELF